MNKQIKILDVKIDILSKQEVLEKIKQLLQTNNHEQLVTVNPEFIIEAQKNQEFKDILNNSWLSVADGYGIRLASKYRSLASNFQFSIFNFQKIIKNLFIGIRVAWWGITKNDKKLDVVKEIITGTDLVPDICRICEKENKKILFFGSPNSKKAEENLKIKYPNLKSNSLILEEEHLFEKINTFRPDVIFVALSAPFAQIWINRNIKKIPDVKLTIGVGGAFDYISGKVKRAPQNWQSSYEWLFRLFKQPRRIKRILNALPKFPWLIFINSIK